MLIFVVPESAPVAVVTIPEVPLPAPGVVDPVAPAAALGRAPVEEEVLAQEEPTLGTAVEAPVEADKATEEGVVASLCFLEEYLNKC